MPVAKKSQCKHPKGFSQIASCKAQGLIPRTSKKNKGKYVISPKYKKSKKKSLKKRKRRSY
jgi:hypothetical protein